MAYEQTAVQSGKNHDISLKDREKMSVSGVEDVKAFDGESVEIMTTQGRLTVRGTNLHVDRIDLVQGHLELQGLVREMQYDEEPLSHTLWSRLFG